MSTRDGIVEAVRTAIRNIWPEHADADFDVEYPPLSRFGDYSVNIAMKLAAKIGNSPRAIAERIISSLGDIQDIERPSIEGGGYINFRVSEDSLKKILAEIIRKKRVFSENKSGKKRHINIEFISANPTGPLTLANGRGGFFGDVLANVLKKSGFVVEREYYINDSGNQVNVLAESVLRKYFARVGIPTPYPEYCYQGDYIDDLAKKLHIPNYNIAKHSMEDIRDKIKDKIVAQMVKEIKRVISEKMKIAFDTFYSERALYEKDGPIVRLLALLREKNLSYEKDGAVWLASSQYGDDKDRVLVKSDKTYAYLLPDIAYHWEKFEGRGFDHVIDVFGADHNAGRMYAAMDMLHQKEKLTIILMQFVRLMQNGQEVKMSKRKGTYVTVEEVIDEVGIDVARFFFLLYAPNTHMDFNLKLAQERSEKNPVYYVQYAHARMCSILKTVSQKGASISKEKTVSPVTRKLLVMMIRWPEVVELVAKTYAVHTIPQFALDYARAVHEWYDKERVLTQNGVVNGLLLKVAESNKILLEDMLTTLGVSSPERME